MCKDLNINMDKPIKKKLVVKLSQVFVQALKGSLLTYSNVLNLMKKIGDEIFFKIIYERLYFIYKCRKTAGWVRHPVQYLVLR